MYLERLGTRDLPVPVLTGILAAMFLRNSIKPVQPPSEPREEVSSRGHFWLGWAMGMLNAAGLWIIGKVIAFALA